MMCVIWLISLRKSQGISAFLLRSPARGLRPRHHFLLAECRGVCLGDYLLADKYSYGTSPSLTGKSTAIRPFSEAM